MLRARYRVTPWWLKVLVIFVVSRVLSTIILLAFAAIQQPNAWTGAQSGYFQFASLWDAHWYYIVSASGYPSALPFTADGHVAENAWAFMPAYPLVVGVVQFLVGVPFAVAAVFVSLGFALATALMFYRLLVLVLPAQTALFSVVLFCCAPLSPLLQVGYAESMQLFLLSLALFLLLRRSYWFLLPVVAVLCITRPSGLAFALALGLHVVYRWLSRGRDPFPLRERVASVCAALFSAVMGLAWPLTAWIATGSFSAYTDTELAWRAPYIGYAGLAPFTPWLQGANWWIHPFPLGVIALLLLLIGFTAFLFTPWVKRLGMDLRFWSASYALYLLAFFFPQSSTFRLLMPMFPLLGALAIPRSPVYRLVLVLLCIAGQVGWVYIAWWVDGYDWTPP